VSFIPREELRGFVGAFKQLREEGKKRSIVAATMLLQMAKRIVVLSQDQVPIETESLKKSCRLRFAGEAYTPAQMGRITIKEFGTRATFEITYGYLGGDVVSRGTERDPFYAVYVHEINKNYNFGKKWKYLEDPAKQVFSEGVGGQPADIQETYAAF
jgi:hypothetical protein